jgi:hypothetical protein
MKVNGSQKFKDILCHDLLKMSVAKADNDYCYVWGECQNKTI